MLPLSLRAAGRPGAAERLFPGEEPLILSEEAAIRGARRAGRGALEAGRRVREAGRGVDVDFPVGAGVPAPRIRLESRTAPVTEPELELGQATLVPDGKRGNVTLDYRLMSRGKEAGLVSKKLVVSGLRDYDPNTMDAVVEQFYRLKEKAWD